jgi:hypothetical protein
MSRLIVMTGLDPVVRGTASRKGVDGRIKSGHDVFVSDRQ